MSDVLIAPSILSCNLAKLQDEVDSIAPYADWIQVDVMDGHFVPNLTFGAPLLKDLKTNLPLDIHLMVTNPAERIEEFVNVGASHITFHAEAVPEYSEQKKLIELIRSHGCTAGIALNPDTPPAAIKELLSSTSSASSASSASSLSSVALAKEDASSASSAPPIDLLLCMTVFPGFSGQSFHAEVLPKITELRAQHPDMMIQVDGGINAETGKHCREAGANNLVSASYIFGNDDREEAIRSLRGE